jgi:endonuclease YncB( thermonuclease family)
MILLALALLAGQSFACDAVALHDVDGPIHCRSGQKIRLQGIGATETDGSCRPSQPCIPGDPRAQRRAMATAVIGARIAPVALRCVATGWSHARITAWCSRGDGFDLSCGAIRVGIAARWARFDSERRLVGCAPRR